MLFSFPCQKGSVEIHILCQLLPVPILMNTNNITHSLSDKERWQNMQGEQDKVTWKTLRFFHDDGLAAEQIAGEFPCNSKVLTPLGGRPLVPPLSNLSVICLTSPKNHTQAI